MADTPYPLTRQTREHAMINGNGGASYGPFAFKIFDTADVEVLTKAAEATKFSVALVTVTKVSGLALDNFTIAFPANVPATTKIKVTGKRLPERSAGIAKGTRLDMDALEKELSKIAAAQQELRRDVMPLDPEIGEGSTLMVSDGRLVEGPSVSEINAAIGYANAAYNSASAAALSASQAAASAAAAALFNPASYYLKSEIDTTFSSYYTAVQVSTLLSGKLDKAGGTLTGPLSLYADAAANLQPVTLQQVPKLVGPLQGAFKNLILSADGLSAPVNIWADEIVLEDASNTYRTRRNVSLSLSLAANGANGLDTGAVAISTWYAVWVIYNPTTDTTAALGSAVGSLTGTFTSGSAVVTGISSTAALAVGMPVSGANVRPGSVIKSVDSGTQVTLSRTATASGSAAFAYVANPVMPSGYTYKARVGMVYTESGANKYPLPFLQVGRRVRWVPTPASNLVNPRQMAALTSTTGTVSTAAFAPPTAQIVTVLLQPPTGSNNSYVHPNANSGGTGSTTYPPQISQGTTSTYVTQMGDLFLETQSLFLSIGSGTGELFSLGYEDNL